MTQERSQDTVPQALICALSAINFEDALHNAVSIGGDSDTLAAITGGIAEAYYGIPADLRKHALTFLDERLMKILIEFENVYAPKLEKSVGEARVAVKKAANGAYVIERFAASYPNIAAQAMTPAKLLHIRETVTPTGAYTMDILETIAEGEAIERLLLFTK